VPVAQLTDIRQDEHYSDRPYIARGTSRNFLFAIALRPAGKMSISPPRTMRFGPCSLFESHRIANTLEFKCPSPWPPSNAEYTILHRGHAAWLDDPLNHAPRPRPQLRWPVQAVASNVRNSPFPRKPRSPGILSTCCIRVIISPEEPPPQNLTGRREHGTIVFSRLPPEAGESEFTWGRSFNGPAKTGWGSR